jgi:hypothetical protein
MTEVPISIELSETDPEITRLERHSYINLINVVHAELQLVERMIEAPGSLRSTVHLAEAASRAFKEPRVARRHAAELARFGDLIESDLAEALAEVGAAADANDVREAVGVLLDVLPNAHLRVHEALVRHTVPRPVADRDATELVRSFARLGVRTFTGGSETVSIPVGLERPLRSIAQTRGDFLKVDVVELYADDALEVRVRGSAPVSYFRPLSQGKRPSELQSILEERGEPFRSAMLLEYYARPDGAVEILLADQGESGSTPFTLTARISGLVPMPDSD